MWHAAQDERLEYYNKMVEASYERAKAVHAVTNFGIDDVVDPATTRTWITAGVRSLPPEMAPAGWVKRKEKKISYIDTW